MLQTSECVIHVLTQNICITLVQCWSNVEDVGSALYEWYTNIQYLLGHMFDPGTSDRRMSQLIDVLIDY